MPSMLIVDDDPHLRRLVRTYAQLEQFQCREADSGQQALALLREADSDIIILDVMMPGQDGFQTLAELRTFSQAPVIMLTARGEEYDQLQGFQSGADDYIPKPFSTTLLLARMEAVLRRAGRERAEVLEAGGIRLFPQQRRVEASGQSVELTRREFDLLHCFLCNQGRILSREQLLNTVWGYDYEGDERTVDTHVKNLRGKLRGCGGCIRTVYRVGYRFEVEP